MLINPIKIFKRWRLRRAMLEGVYYFMAQPMSQIKMDDCNYRLIDQVVIKTLDDIMNKIEIIKGNSNADSTGK
jgi:hypothetical protein